VALACATIPGGRVGAPIGSRVCCTLSASLMKVTMGI
jgi:hypothetical protein